VHCCGGEPVALHAWHAAPFCPHEVLDSLAYGTHTLLLLQQPLHAPPPQPQAPIVHESLADAQLEQAAPPVPHIPEP
jgi:hypothetical protein